MLHNQARCPLLEQASQPASRMALTSSGRSERLRKGGSSDDDRKPSGQAGLIWPEHVAGLPGAGNDHIGQLQRLIEDDGLRGMTSNPTIFEKSIAGSGDYDEVILPAGWRGTERRGDLSSADGRGYPGGVRSVSSPLRLHRRQGWFREPGGLSPPRARY